MKKIFFVLAIFIGCSIAKREIHGNYNNKSKSSSIELKADSTYSFIQRNHLEPSVDYGFWSIIGPSKIYLKSSINDIEPAEVKIVSKLYQRNISDSVCIIIENPVVHLNYSLISSINNGPCRFNEFHMIKLPKVSLYNKMIFLLKLEYELWVLPAHFPKKSKPFYINLSEGNVFHILVQNQYLVRKEKRIRMNDTIEFRGKKLFFEEREWTFKK